MKRSVIRLLCGAGILLVMACGAYALATGDSLVTLSYIKNTFIPAAVEQGTQAGNEKLQETYDSAKKTLDALQQGYQGGATSGSGSGSYSATLQARSWTGGDVIELTTGSGTMLMEGTASVTHNGAFIDVTTGTEVASGTQLTANHRYLVGEDTLAKVTILSGEASLGVQGGYSYTQGSGTGLPFYDVSSGDWYYSSVEYVYKNKLFSGMDEHHFGPYAAMNRAMLMTVLYQIAGAPEQELAEASIISFDDVAESDWYAPYVKWGAAQGITAGTGERTFSPQQQVTREQVVALLYSFTTNYLGLEVSKGADLSGYQDLNQASDWAREALSWAVGEGIVSGTSTEAPTLSPRSSANRAEVATMLRSYAEKIL